MLDARDTLGKEDNADNPIRNDGDGAIMAEV
jgi:hypothetical protein